MIPLLSWWGRASVAATRLIDVIVCSPGGLRPRLLFVAASRLRGEEGLPVGQGAVDADFGDVDVEGTVDRGGGQADVGEELAGVGAGGVNADRAGDGVGDGRVFERLAERGARGEDVEVEGFAADGARGSGRRAGVGRGGAVD